MMLHSALAAQVLLASLATLLEPWFGLLVSAFPPHYRRPTRQSLRSKSSAADIDDLARRIGLNVVDLSKAKAPVKLKKPKNQKIVAKENRVKMKRNAWTATKNESQDSLVQWSMPMERFFWSTDYDRDGVILEEEPSPRRNTTINSAGDNSAKGVTIQRIPNQEAFPLILLHDFLPPDKLAQAISLTDSTGITDNHHGQHVVEELEQHKREPNGSVRTLRRSLVARLDPLGALGTLLSSQLPSPLAPLETHSSSSQQQQFHHPYEDGSVVYYRTGRQDFYDVHHDSHASQPHSDRHPAAQQRQAPPSTRHRAYTLLVYLRTPPGPPSHGGTEFPNLTKRLIIEHDDNNDDDDDDDAIQNTTDAACRWCTDPSVVVSSRDDAAAEAGLVVKPSAGDALVWPNFDRDGTPDYTSLHRALPVSMVEEESSPKGRQQKRRRRRPQKSSDTVGKIVVNAWWEGATPE